MGRRTFIICDDCQGEEFRLSEDDSQGWEAQCLACRFRFPLVRQEEGATAPRGISWDADPSQAMVGTGHVQEDMVSTAKRGKRCPQGCTCGRHKRLILTNNTNWDAMLESFERRMNKA